MKRILLILTYWFFLGTPIYICGQSLVGGRICNSAASQTSNSGQTIISTFGGCPNCGQFDGNSGSISTGLPIDDGNCFSVAFDFDSQLDDCGSIYDFFYTGNADLSLVSFEWDFGQAAFPNTSTEVNPSGVVYSAIGEQDISLRIFNDDCDITVSGLIMINNIGFSAAFDKNDVSCNGLNDGNISLEIIGGNSPFEISWSTGATDNTINNLSPGNYEYTITDNAGCATSDLINIVQADPIAIEFINTDETCQDAVDGIIELIISGGVTPYNVSWQDGSSETNRNQLTSGTYNLTITDSNDCIETASTFINQTCNPQIFNTISPNGDDINDVWRIKGIESFPENEVRIYNRWGDLVYQKDAYVNDWSGTNTAGESLPAGAYYYVINYNDEENKVLTGSITIIR